VDSAPLTINNVFLHYEDQLPHPHPIETDDSSHGGLTNESGVYLTLSTNDNNSSGVSGQAYHVDGTINGQYFIACAMNAKFPITSDCNVNDYNWNSNIIIASGEKDYVPFNFDPQNPKISKPNSLELNVYDNAGNVTHYSEKLPSPKVEWKKDLTNKFVVVSATSDTCENNIYYSVDEQKTWHFGAKVALYKNTNVYFKAIDKFHQETPVAVARVNNIMPQEIEPVINAHSSSSTPIDVSIKYNRLYIPNVDAGKRIIYSVNNGSSWIPYTKKFTVYKSTKIIARVVSDDFASSIVQKTINIKLVSPKIKILKNKVKITFSKSIKAQYKKYNYLYYRLKKNGKWKKYKKSFKIKKGTTVYAQNIDKWKNKSKVVKKKRSK
jgi:hypothetical protein